MKRAVVAIGVQKTGGLPELQAARQGAEAFAQWAIGHQGIPKAQVRLITDARSRVTRERIFDAVEKFTRLGFIEQLIVYFSGHGINSGLYEQWLLSRAPEDPGAAVNLRGSEMLARYCGVGHVVFVSDACRTAADSLRTQGISGGEIFPNLGLGGAENPVDQYFATLVGDPAFEVRDAASSAANFRAAYSTVLLEALSGKAPAIVDAATGRRLIRPRPLKKHLAVAVPDFLLGLNLPGSVTQQPDARIESDETAWIAELPPEAPGAVAKPGAVSKRSRPGSPAARRRMRGDEVMPEPAVLASNRRVPNLATEAQRRLRSAIDPASVVPKRLRGARAAPDDASLSMLDQAMQRSASAFGPDHFETGCGIKLRGARVADVLGRAARASIGTRGDVVQVDLDASRHAANIALATGDGSSLVVPVFRGWITSLSFTDDARLQEIACNPSANTPRHDEWQSLQAERGNVRAVLSATSRMGVLQLGDAAQADELLQRLRRTRSLDPATAVLIAWALHDLRLRERILELQALLDADLRCRVFDVALLAQALGRAPLPGEPRELVPCVPMLAQGWALLGPMGVGLLPPLAALRARLRPGVFTQFEPGATRALFDFLATVRVP
jgi:hypothetical protein